MNFFGFVQLFFVEKIKKIGTSIKKYKFILLEWRDYMKYNTHEPMDHAYMHRIAHKSPCTLPKKYKELYIKNVICGMK